jgi:hypothetical protein
MSWVDAVRGLLLEPVLGSYRYSLWRPLLKAAELPRQAQETVLRSILAINRDTRFGKMHGFNQIRTVADFQRNVPWRDYEGLRPYIEEQEQTGAPVLMAEPPVMYARTSGTTGEHKLIPISESSLRLYRRHQRMWASLQQRMAPRVFRGKSLAIVSPAVEGHLDSGRPFGSMSGYVYRTMPALVRHGAVIPPAVLEIDDYHTRYQIILRLALAERGITNFATANPSTFLRLKTELIANQAMLIESIASGKLSLLDHLPEAARREVSSRLRADPARAAELARLADSSDLTYAKLWPDMQLLTTWTAGNCALALESLRPELPSGARVLELGYVASEFRGTLTIDADGGGLPLLQDHFFEFVERADWESGREKFLTLYELEQDKDYYVFVTSGALYRYAMDDILRVTGFYKQTPLLRFRQKGKGCTSITGEKLYESQLLEAMERMTRALDIACKFFVLLADEVANGYELYVELELFKVDAARIARWLDDALSELNLEYGAKRDSGRLNPLKVTLLKSGSGENYVRHCVARGQREGQFKHIAVQYRREVSFSFEEHAMAIAPQTRRPL